MIKHYSKILKKRQRGFTLVELLVASAILLVLVGIIISYMFQSFESNQYIKVQSYMRDSTQRFMYYLSKELAQSRKVFSNNTVGNNFKNKLPLSTTERQLAVFPTIRPNGSFVKTQTCDFYPDSYTWPLSMGNSLMFLKLTKTMSDYGFPGSVVQQKLDLYQFVLYFVKSDDTTLPFLDVWNSAPSRRPMYLVEWKSKYYADYNQFRTYMTYLQNSGNNARRGDVVSQLNSQQVTALLDTTQSNPNDAFFSLAATASPTKKATGYKIEELTRRNPVLLQSTQETIYSVAYNQSDDFPIQAMVPVIYDESPDPDAASCGAAALPASAPFYGGPADAFPGGFEVGIAGPNSGRAVHINLTYIGRFRGRRFVEQQRTFNAYARDY